MKSRGSPAEQFDDLPLHANVELMVSMDLEGRVKCSVQDEFSPTRFSEVLATTWAMDIEGLLGLGQVNGV